MKLFTSVSLRFFVALQIVLGDMCEEFCFTQLGPSGCPKGSWCKNNYDCHGLFWTGPDRRGVCVLDGIRPCTDTYPVLCNEAVARLTQPTSTTTTTTTTTTRSPRTQTGSQDLSFIDLIFPLLAPLVCNPYVRINFLHEGRNLGYWAVFDSAAQSSYAMLEPPVQSGRLPLSLEPRFCPLFGSHADYPISRPANASEAYSLRSRSSRDILTNPGTLAFGIVLRRFNHSGTIDERARIFSGGGQSFEFDLRNMYLVPPPGDGYRVLLGSAYDSDFARAAGTFALIPGSYILNGYRMAVGRGAADFVQQFCANGTPIIWYYLSCRRSWSTIGTMELVSSADTIFSPHYTNIQQTVELLIDTGALRYWYATSEMVDRVRAILRAHGATESLDSSPTSSILYQNCFQSVLQSLPTFTIRLSPLTTYLFSHRYVNEIRVEPSQYLTFPHDEPLATCRLSLINGQVHYRDRILVSNNFLMMGISVFDRENARFGFCPKDDTRINQWIS